MSRFTFLASVPSGCSAPQTAPTNCAAIARPSTGQRVRVALVRRVVVAAVAVAATVAGATTMSLDDAIALALQHNQRIKVSSFSPGIGRANVLAEYGRFDPALTFNRSYAENALPPGSTTPTGGLLFSNQLLKEDDYGLALNGLTPWGLSYQVGATATNQRGTFNKFTDQYVTFGGVTVTQPLLRGFGFGANLADLRIAKANRGISDWEHRRTVIEVVTDVMVAYANLAEARDELAIARGSRDLAGQLVNENEKRNKFGSIADADVTQARARMAERDELVLVAERSVHDAENRLRQLTGETVVGPDGPAIAVDALVAVDPPKVDGAAALRQALELRPDYQEAKLGLTKSQATHAAARNGLLPRVDFVGSYGYNGNDSDFPTSRAQVRNRDFRAYSAGVVVSVPLTFAEGRGRARAAKLAVQQSEADLVRLEQDVALSVADAIGQLETTARRVAATTKAYELAQQALDAEQKRFRAGTSTTFFVLQLQEELALVQSNRVHAIADERRAVANFEQETGTTLLTHHLTLAEN